MFAVYHQLQSEARNFFAKSVILFTSNEAVVSSSLEWNDSCHPTVFPLSKLLSEFIFFGLLILEISYNYVCVVNLCEMPSCLRLLVSEHGFPQSLKFKVLSSPLKSNANRRCAFWSSNLGCGLFKLSWNASCLDCHENRNASCLFLIPLAVVVFSWFCCILQWLIALRKGAWIIVT